MDDWKKLIRLLGYLKGTRELYLTLFCMEIRNWIWVIDGSYTVHDDMKGRVVLF
jgi:hypothetical protein